MYSTHPNKRTTWPFPVRTWVKPAGQQGMFQTQKILKIVKIKRTTWLKAIRLHENMPAHGRRLLHLNLT